MSRVARNRANLAAFAGMLAALSLAVAWLGTTGAGAAASGDLVVQPSLGAPADVFLGASPQEAPGEAWATARDAAGTLSLARYTDANGWDRVAEPLPPDLLSFFVREGATAGRATPRGGVAVAAEAEDSSFEQVEFVLVRDPGGRPRLAEAPTALLEEGFEGSLFGPPSEPILLAASDEAGGRTGAYVVPESRRRVLHYDGSAWTSERICMDAAPACTEPLFSFGAYGIDSAGSEAWLVGTGGTINGGIELFRREAGAWRLQPLGPLNSLGARLAQEEPGSAGVAVKPRPQGQPLTVTSAGIWIDFRLEQGAAAQDATAYFDTGQDQVTGSWCDVTPALCAFPLGNDLPQGDGRSFAWPPSGSSGPFGTRAITGVGAGAILSLEGSVFRRLTFVGGDAGSSQGAALSSPEEGWLGASPPLQLTRTPQASRLQSWPVPFRRPLTAIAGEPGKGAGALGAEALAVGVGGQVARYVPGIGWEPEFLLRGSGKRATPTLRGVAWPEPGLAYAVGDGAAMWRWQKATGLWQPDPGAPASLARANFTGIAFDPANPSRGYAVGKQGVLLGFGRQWTQETLPAEIPAEANFSSVSFAGSEAIATWKYPKNETAYSGGVIVNDGSGWRIDAAAQEALGGAIPQRVAGLPDGGAAIATLGSGEGQQVSGRVIVRAGAGGFWQVTPGGLTGFPAALAAVREGGAVRAVVSVASQSPGEQASDREQIFNQPPPGQAPLLTAPYALPASGALLRQTPSGWRDEQRQQYPLPPHASGQVLYDLPVRSDPVLALLISPDGSDGWAVGGDTASNVDFLSSQVQTAAVLRYGSAAAPPSNATAAPIPAAGGATFAIGGHARCAAPCADFAGAGIGPDRWLPNAVSRAAGVPGIRALIYTGGSVAANLGNPSSEVPLAKSIAGSAFQREEEAYARRLGGAAGSLPVFAAPSQTDLDAASSLSTFQAVFSGFGQPFGAAAPGRGIAPVSASGPGKAYYSFDSSGAGGAVRVIVLDYSFPTLGETQQCWLARELTDARGRARPAIVVGERDLAGLAPNAAGDRVQIVRTLVGLETPCPLSGPQGAASAYFFDFPEENRAYRLNSGGRSLSTFGSGTLGYVEPPAATKTDFAGGSGFFVVSVEADKRDPSTNVAPVGVKLAPAIGSLALDATDGTLLRRSQPALFEGLARRALAGSECEGSVNAPGRCEKLSPPPYVPIPSRCQGANCATSVFPEYAFTSSEPDIADFVAADPTSNNPRNVLLVKKKPVLDSHSGLLCAFNAGTTIVTVTTGGLSYSQKVTVQAGTVQQPCGTTPLRNRQAISDEPLPPPAPAPTPEGGPLPNDTPPPPPPPPPASAQPQPAPPVQKASPSAPPTPISYFPVTAPAAVPLVPIVPPPPLPAVQPTPPSGTSQVNAVEEEEEPEEATESSSAFAALPAPGPANVSLRQRDSEGGVPLLIPVVVLVAAIAAAAIGGGRRRPRPAFQSASTKRHSNRRYR